MLRSLLEKWSRGIILKRRLPAEFGSRSIFVSPEGGGLRYWKLSLDSIDPMLLSAVRKFIKPGSVIWDAGGNLGFFAFTSIVQSKGGRVAVFEPDISLCHLLRRSADANPDLHVDVFPLAVSNRDGFAQFNIAERARSTNFLAESAGSSQTGGVRRTLTVPTIQLDSFLTHYPAPDFIKIDVEGAENLVFEGMQQILISIRPIIMCEYSIENASFIKEKLQAANYQIYNAETLPELTPFSDQSQNLLAIPL